MEDVYHTRQYIGLFKIMTKSYCTFEIHIKTLNTNCRIIFK